MASVKLSAVVSFIMGIVFCTITYAWGELPRYEIKASFDPRQHTLEATQAVTFTNNSSKPVTNIYFHIYPHRTYSRDEISMLNRYAGYFKVTPYPEGFQPGGMDIKDVHSGSRRLSYIIEGADATILNVSLADELAPGESITIDMSYSVVIPHSYGRFGWHQNITVLTRWYPILSVLDDAGWHNYPYYIYHQPFFSDAAYYTLYMTVPHGQCVVSGGTPAEETPHEDGTKTVKFSSKIPMRDLGVGISADFSSVELEQDGYTIRAYYVDGNRKAALKAAENAAALMRFYSARFGAYPYKEFSIVPVYLGFGGDQSSGIVFIDTRLYRLPRLLSRYFDFLISHETGHQWFYNIVGSDEYKEMFLDEAMNSYWLLQYLEDRYGYNAYVMDLPRWLSWLIPNFSFRNVTLSRYAYLSRAGYDRPVIGELSSFREPSSIFSLAYGKGTAVLLTLEGQVGKDVFERAVCRYTKEFAFKNFSVADFRRIISEESGMDMKAFFDQWLMTDKQCDFAVHSVSSGRVIIENKGTLQMPVETVVSYADGTQKRDRWDGEGNQHIIATDPSKKISRVGIDPEEAIPLDRDRTNNYFPRRTSLRLAPLYFFAYELPFFYSRESYNIAAGPTVGGSSVGVAASTQKPYESLIRMSSMYDFNGKAFDSRIGYQIDNIAGKQNSLGFEVFDYDSSKEKNDVAGGKIYWRRELWPANYGLFDVNDHATFYFIRDQRLNSGISLNGREDMRNLHYWKKNEAIFGITGSFGRYGPYADPSFGWRIIPTQEIAGHILGGDQAFWRTSMELQKYHSVSDKHQHKIAARLKAGWGEHSDKDLFELGGPDGLRGYGLKEIQGSHCILAGAEYRLPIINNMRLCLFDNILCLNAIQGVGFFDAGKSWFSSFHDADFKKDAGIGLRMHFNVCGILERLVVRFDIAEPINDHKKDTHFWFGINQAF